MSRLQLPQGPMRPRARTLALSGTAVLALGAAGCGSSSSSSPAPASGPAGATATQAKGVNPNGPEVSPSGDIPDNQAYVAYSPPGAKYSVKVPEGWARSAAGGATTFTDKLNRVRMQTMPAQKAPTVASARSTLVPQLAKTVPGFKSPKVSSVNRPAGQAVKIAYLATSPKDPVTGKTHVDAVERYVFFHQGKDVILTLSGPKGADNVDPYKIVTDSLRYTA